MNNTNLFLVSVVLAVAAPAADIDTAAAPENEAAAIVAFAVWLSCDQK